MTNERKIEILEQIAYELTDDHHNKYYDGLCSLVGRVVPSYFESIQMRQFIHKNRPKWYNKLFWNKHFRPFNSGGYWWTRDADGYEQRLKFIASLIKKLL